LPTRNWRTETEEKSTWIKRLSFSSPNPSVGWGATCTTSWGGAGGPNLDHAGRVGQVAVDRDHQGFLAVLGPDLLHRAVQDSLTVVDHEHPVAHRHILYAQYSGKRVVVSSSKRVIQGVSGPLVLTSRA
jgi:hypothetical protein